MISGALAYGFPVFMDIWTRVLQIMCFGIDRSEYMVRLLPLWFVFESNKRKERFPALLFLKREVI